MKPSRTSRIIAAVIAVFSLLTTQLALASYACPALAAPERVVAMAGMDNCSGMDMEQPGLCHAQGHAVHQSLDKPDLPQVPPFLVAGPVLQVQLPDYRGFIATPVHDAVELARSTSPPLAIRHCCFRI
jgi:hypothetical protein